MIRHTGDRGRKREDGQTEQTVKKRQREREIIIYIIRQTGNRERMVRS